MNKRIIPFIVMGGVVVIGLGVMVGFIVANANRKPAVKEIDKVQGTWEIYNYDTDPANWDKPLVRVQNQFMVFEDDHMTYYVNGNVAYTADVKLDENFLTQTPTGTSKAGTLPEKLRYRRYSDYNIELLDEVGSNGKPRRWDFIKHSGTYNQYATYADSDINGVWDVNMRSHVADTRQLTVNAAEKKISILNKETNQMQEITYAWKEGEVNTFTAQGMGDVHVYKPTADVLFFVQQKDCTVWELRSTK